MWQSQNDTAVAEVHEKTENKECKKNNIKICFIYQQWINIIMGKNT